MSAVPVDPAPALVRVGVTSRDRQVDLAVPGAVPVAHLLPELARSLGVLDVRTAHSGFRLVTAAGRVLDSTAGLARQGVGHGALLSLTPVTADAPVRLHDDVAEAMGELSQARPGLSGLSGHAPGVTVQQAAGAAVLLLGAPGMAIIGTTGAAVGAGAVALGLLGVAVVHSRSSPAPSRWLTAVLSGTGAAHAAAGGSLLAAQAAAGAALPVVGAGAGAVLASVVAMVGLGRGRLLVLPWVLLGGVTLAAGMLVRVTGAPIGVVLTMALVLLVLGAGASPGLALAAAGANPGPIQEPEVAATHGPVDLTELLAQAHVARELLLCVAVTIGVLLLAVVPLAVSQGPPGTLLVSACCLVVMLRTRGHRGGPEVTVALASGASGLVLVAASAFVLEPGWRPVTVLLLVVVGSAVLVSSLVPTTRPARWARVAEVAELVALASLPPGVLLMTGTLARITG